MFNIIICSDVDLTTILSKEISLQLAFNFLKHNPTNGRGFDMFHSIWKNRFGHIYCVFDFLKLFLWQPRHQSMDEETEIMCRTVLLLPLTKICGEELTLPSNDVQQWDLIVADAFKSRNKAEQMIMHSINIVFGVSSKLIKIKWSSILFIYFRIKHYFVNVLKKLKKFCRAF